MVEQITPILVTGGIVNKEGENKGKPYTTLTYAFGKSSSSVTAKRTVKGTPVMESVLMSRDFDTLEPGVVYDAEFTADVQTNSGGNKVNALRLVAILQEHRGPAQNPPATAPK